MSDPSANADGTDHVTSAPSGPLRIAIPGLPSVGMRIAITIFVITLAVICVVASKATNPLITASPQPGALSPNSLCAKNERIIFSCPVKRPAKIVSVCASKDLTSERGYLQYRFGLPGKIELEFPKDRTGTQQKFQYTHYFRARFDLTEINFTIDDYQYQVFDDYNGEEKPAISSQGVSVTAPGKPKEVSFVCRTKPKADYADLQAVLPNGQE
jgi:hypothetical protein